VQISQWKKQLLDGVESLFGEGCRRERDESLAIQAELYEQIGRLNREVEWWKNGEGKRSRSHSPRPARPAGEGVLKATPNRLRILRR
jgi:putative transposase